MFESKRDKRQCTFFFELNSKNLPAGIHGGLYMLAIYKISVNRTLFEKQIVTDSLYPILYDVQNGCIIQNHEVAEKFMGRAQVDGCYAPLEECNRLNNETIDDLRYDFSDCADEYIHHHQRELQIRIDNSKKLRYQQTIQFYESRQKNFERNINTYEGIRECAMAANDKDEVRRAENVLRLQRANLRDLLNRRETDLERISRDVHLLVTHEIKSLNLVKVV